MAFLARKTVSRSKCVNFFITQNIKKLFQTSTIFVGSLKEKQGKKLSGNGSLLDVYGRRTKQSQREKSRSNFSHVFSVFSALYICTCGRVECMEKDESSFSMSATGVIETPETNHHNKRNLNGRFAKVRNVGHKEKSLQPMKTALAARRSLVFDECEENEPPSKRKTRSEKVHAIQDNSFVFTCIS